MKKRLLSILFITLILISSFFSCYQIDYIAYASSPEGYTQASSESDLVSAFRAYCKSRNLAIEGSVADAVTKFTTQTFNNICNTLGYDPTTLQAELYYKTSGNTGLQWYFTSTGIAAYNRIFAEFLQNNNLQVGDSVNDQNLYDGYLYNNSLVWVVNNLPINSAVYPSSNISQRGSFYLYSTNDLVSLSGSTVSFNFNNESLTYDVSEINNNTYGKVYSSGGYNFKGEDANNIYYFGFYCLVYNVSNTSINLCFYQNNLRKSTNRHQESIYIKKSGSSPQNLVPVTINITTNNTTINNNTYEGDTIINPDGGDDPGGGGDDPGGSDDPIVDPTPDPDPDIPDWDIELPDLTQNDWLLYGLEKKFPWSIPFDLMFILSLLNAEPETPHFEGTVSLGVVDWDYDIDLSPFDTIAGYFREFFFLSFIIGLMYMTKQLIWG